MNNKSQALNFLRENLGRLFTKSPLFFKIWQWVWGIVLVITGIPELLQQFGVVLPEPFDTLANKAVTLASSVGYIMSLFPTDAKVVASTDNGTLLKKTDEVKLPFTAKAEERAEIKKQDGILNPEAKNETEITELTIKK